MREKSTLKLPAKNLSKSNSAPHSLDNNKLSTPENDNLTAKSRFATQFSRKTSGGYGSRGVRGTIGIEQTITIVQKISLRQETPFTESCLPRTMKIALESKDLLFPLLQTYPSSWSFIDKVFVMLASVFQADVAKYYANKGQCLMKMYSCMQIERFDKILMRDLIEKIETIKLSKNDTHKSQSK